MIISILVVGIIGLLIGILLSLASIKFEVKVDDILVFHEQQAT